MERSRKLFSLSLHFQPFLLVILLLVSSQLVISHSTVRYLPGFQGTLPFELETGYVSVDVEGEDAQLFYYFVKSERNPREDPLILWLTGGPGCSAFSGLAFEIGPIKFKVVENNGSLPSLVPNPDSWTKVSSIIFVDSPVGTGFSYTGSWHSPEMGDIKQSQHVYQFLRKWLIDHPEFLSNPFYIGGDSYSGLIVPVVIQYVSNGNEAGIEPFINIKGYLLGNAVTVPHMESNKQIPYVHGMGLISDELYKSSKRSCKGEYVNISPNNSWCLEDVQAIKKCLSGINTAQILEPQCVLLSPKPLAMLGNIRSLSRNLKEFFDPLPTFGCRSYAYLLSHYWMNDNRVREALHIRKGTVKVWKRCDYEMPYKKEIQSSFAYHVNLSKRGYRSLIYSGDHDLLVPFLATQAWIRALNYSIVDDWRPWRLDGQVAGFTRTYSNRMTFATVKGGGHTAPEYKPKECFAMIKRWLSQEPL